jgi:hypothetical protein
MMTLRTTAAWFRETTPKWRQWEWVQTFGVPIQGIRQLETVRVDHHVTPLPEKVLHSTGNTANRVIQLPGQIFCDP